MVGCTYVCIGHLGSSYKNCALCHSSSNKKYTRLESNRKLSQADEKFGVGV